MAAAIRGEVTGAGLEEAGGIFERADDAGRRAAEVAEAARRLIDESRRLRRAPDSDAGMPRFFALHGEVAGEPVRGSWFRGALDVSRALAARAEILIALGEEFGGADTRLPASLDRPLAALLTLVRACDRVSLVRFGPLPAGGRPDDAEP